jgi:hypothetical protein
MKKLILALMIAATASADAVPGSLTVDGVG